MKTPRVVLSAIAVSLLSLPLVAQDEPIGGRVLAKSQARGSASALKERARVVDTHRLRAAAGSATEFESFVVEVLDDGTRVVRGTHRLDDRGDSSRYRWTADVEAGTYTVERIPLTAEQLREMRPERDRVQANDIEDPPNYCEDPSPEMCNERCSGNWTATVTTYDPVYIQLTRTTISGNWGVFGATVCRWRESYFGSCWANAATAAGTTWYTDSCVRSGSTGQGRYHNDDFGLNSQRTYSTSTVGIRRVSGLGTFVDWSASFSGEGAWLLHGTMDEAGSNDCF